MPEDNDDTVDELDSVTDSTDARWAYLGSLITGIVLTGYMLIIGLTAAGFFSLAGITQPWFLLTSTVVSMAAVWLWGTDAWNAVRNNDNE